MAPDGFLGRALRDPATGLPNVPYLQLIRDWEERRARRRRYAVRVLKIAVTGGDDSLRRVLSWRLIRTLRDSDFIASRGPSHFEVLLTTPDAEQADKVRARIRGLVAELNERQPSETPLSVGVEIEETPVAAQESARRGHDAPATGDWAVQRDERGEPSP